MTHDHTDWSQAACATADPLLFDATTDLDSIETAWSYCDRCPLVPACEAVRSRDKHYEGVAAGRVWYAQPPSRAAKCGTVTGYRLHLTRGQTPCRKCRVEAGQETRRRARRVDTHAADDRVLWDTSQALLARGLTLTAIAEQLGVSRRRLQAARTRVAATHLQETG